MQAIVRACASEGWPARIAAVISNRADAPGLEAARAMGLETEVVDHRRFASREAFDAQLSLAVERRPADLLVLAGFMRILTPEFVRRFDGRMVNIHPSLLPAFAGMHTHRRVLEAGCKVTGATVHYVTPELDHGPIIAQAVVPVLPSDDESSLAARVAASEHVLYPRALGWLLADVLELRGGVVRHKAGSSQLLS